MSLGVVCSMSLQEKNHVMVTWQLWKQRNWYVMSRLINTISQKLLSLRCISSPADTPRIYGMRAKTRFFSDSWGFQKYINFVEQWMRMQLLVEILSWCQPYYYSCVSWWWSREQLLSPKSPDWQQTCCFFPDKIRVSAARYTVALMNHETYPIYRAT